MHSSLKTVGLGILCLTIGACSRQATEQAAPAAAVEPADLVLSNAYVYTVDGQGSIAEAVAVQGNRIVAVGSNQDMQAYIGSDTRAQDLGGRMVMPGIHDTHIHALATVEPDVCDFRGEAKSLEEMVPFLRDCLARYVDEPGEWLPVLQWPFSRGNQSSARYPTLRAALDAVSTDHPIILWGDDAHHGAANSAALASAKDATGNTVGITAASLTTTFSTWRGQVAVDANGEPSGGINEDARLLIRPSFTQDYLGIGADPTTTMPRVAKVLASRGITSIQDPLVVPESLQMYRWLESHGQMSFRMRAGLYSSSGDAFDRDRLASIPASIKALQQMRADFADSRYIHADGVKLFADAVLEGNPFTHPPTQPVAAVLNGFQQPLFAIDEATGAIDIKGYVDLDAAHCVAYRAAPQDYASPAASRRFVAEHGYLPAQCARNSGVLEHSEAYLHEYVRQATDAGFHVHIHALSDRGVRVAVDALADAKASAYKQGLTQSLAHVQLAHPGDQQRIGELGMYVAFTYAWMTPEIDYNLMVIPFIEQVQDADHLFDPDSYYMHNVYPVKNIQQAGGVPTFGSDAPVDNRDPVPFYSMQQAVTRAAGGRVLNASQRISIEDAIAAFTINGARMLSQDQDVGSIEVGKLADLIVLDQNVVALAHDDHADQIANTQVVMTVFDGRIVYRQDDAVAE